eukprot:s418_g25.t1
MELIEAGLSSTAVKWRTSDGEMNTSSSDAQYQMTRPLDGVLENQCFAKSSLDAMPRSKVTNKQAGVKRPATSYALYVSHVSRATSTFPPTKRLKQKSPTKPIGGALARRELADLREYWKAKAKEKAMANKVARSLHKPEDRKRKKSGSEEKGTTSDNGSEEAKSQVSLSWMGSPLAIVKQLGEGTYGSVFEVATRDGLGMSSDDEKVAMRISKRQRAVRHLVRPCLHHSLPIPDDLSYLARAVTDWGNFQADFMSKGTFEKLMSDSRHAISEKLTPEELEIKDDVQDQTATSVSRFQESR